MAGDKEHWISFCEVHQLSACKCLDRKELCLECDSFATPDSDGEMQCRCDELFGKAGEWEAAQARGAFGDVINYIKYSDDPKLDEMFDQALKNVQEGRAE